MKRRQYMGNKARLHPTHEKYLKQCGHYAGEMTRHNKHLSMLGERQLRLLDLTKRVSVGRENLHTANTETSKIRNQERMHNNAVRWYMSTGRGRAVLSKVPRPNIMRKEDYVDATPPPDPPPITEAAHDSDENLSVSLDDEEGGGSSRLSDAMRTMVSTFRPRKRSRPSPTAAGSPRGPKRRKRGGVEPNAEPPPQRTSRRRAPERQRHLYAERCVVTSLHHHQRVAVAWLMLRERLPFRDTLAHGSILADDMGLGKTLTIISLVDALRTTDRAPTLVVVPANLVKTWMTQCRMHAPNLRLRAITDRNVVDSSNKVVSSATSRTGTHRTTLHWSMRRDIETILEADMVVISYDKLRSTWDGIEQSMDIRVSRRTMARQNRRRRQSMRQRCLRHLTSDERVPEASENFATLMFTLCWQRVVLDECTFVKNNNTKVFSAVSDLTCRAIVALSGTPVENTVEDMRSYLCLMRSVGRGDEHASIDADGTHHSGEAALDADAPIDSRSAWIQFVDSSDRSGRRLTSDGISNLHRQFLDVIQLSRNRRDCLRVNPLEPYLVRASRVMEGDDGDGGGGGGGGGEEGGDGVASPHFYPDLSDEEVARQVVGVSAALRRVGMPSVSELSAETAHMRNPRVGAEQRRRTSGVASRWTRRNMVIHAPMHSAEAAIIEKGIQTGKMDVSESNNGGISQWQWEIGVVSDYREFCEEKYDYDAKVPPTKFQMLARYVRACKPEERIVVFSKRIKFFGRLKRYLEHTLADTNTRCAVYTGKHSESDKRRAVDLLRTPLDKGGARVMLMSTGCGAFGINELVVANHAVIYNADFNPASDEQCIARVDRSGQRNHFVYATWLSVHKSVDERINESFVTKKELITHVMEGGSRGTSTDDRVSVRFDHPIAGGGRGGEESIDGIYNEALAAQAQSSEGEETRAKSRMDADGGSTQSCPGESLIIVVSISVTLQLLVLAGVLIWQIKFKYVDRGVEKMQQKIPQTDSSDETSW